MGACAHSGIWSHDGRRPPSSGKEALCGRPVISRRGFLGRPAVPAAVRYYESMVPGETDAGHGYTEDDLSALSRVVIARCVPDPKQRGDIQARVHARELLSDLEVSAARRLLATASPHELDAAFALAGQRGTFGAPSTSGVVARLEPTRDVADQRSERTSEAAPSFTFAVPGDLAARSGLAGRGELQVHQDRLSIAIDCVGGGDGLVLVAASAGDGPVAGPVMLRPDLDHPRRLVGAIDWPSSTMPSGIVMSMVDRT